MNPMSPTTPAGAAESASEAIRTLSRLTIGGTGYLEPSEVDAVVSELATLAHRLPQALSQAAEWLRRAHVDRLVRHDGETTISGVLAGVAAAQADSDLAEAAYRAHRLAESLEAVRTATSHLGRR